MSNQLLQIVNNKILSLSQANTLRQIWQQQHKKVVFSNGVFDILHAGHLQSLIHAAALGDRLIIGLNADASVKRLKGPSRPIIHQQDRALLLAGLFFVDMVIIFEEDTPIKLIEALLPNVLVKSADYSVENIVGAKEVLANGGEVKIMPFVHGLSTTAIINKIQNETNL